jgi:hypothetical protein
MVYAIFTEENDSGCDRPQAYTTLYIIIVIYISRNIFISSVTAYFILVIII